MTTSGTIGLTRYNTARVIEKAIRRCGLNPAAITPETVETAKEDLFLLLLSLSNKGLNLWTIDQQLMTIVPFQATYTLPIGTQDLLNVLQATPTLNLAYILTAPAIDTSMVVFDEPDQKTVRIGIRFNFPVAGFTLESSTDGILWGEPQSFQQINTSMVADRLYWYDVDKAMVGQYLRFVFDSAALVNPLETLYMASAVREIVVTPFNRDDYSNQPNKTFNSNTTTNYWFQKLINPKITLWPVPNDETRHLVLFRYRQVQDIGDLTDEIEIPSRWYEAICWHLALRLAFELPGIDPGRITAVQAMAQSMVIEVEAGETDDAPVFFQPNIGVYTR